MALKTRVTKLVCISTGDRDGVLARRDKLVEAHLHLVGPIARRIKISLPESFELDDLISTGQMGLIRAATRYRPQTHGGAPFSAFAQKFIRGAMLESVRRSKWTENTRPPIIDFPEPSVLPVVEIDIDQQRMADKIRAVVATLPEHHRKVIEFHYSKGRPLCQLVSDTTTPARKQHKEAMEALRREWRRRAA